MSDTWEVGTDSRYPDKVIRNEGTIIAIVAEQHADLMGAAPDLRSLLSKAHVYIPYDDALYGEIAELLNRIDGAEDRSHE